MNISKGKILKYIRQGYSNRDIEALLDKEWESEGRFSRDPDGRGGKCRLSADAADQLLTGLEQAGFSLRCIDSETIAGGCSETYQGSCSGFRLELFRTNVRLGCDSIVTVLLTAPDASLWTPRHIASAGQFGEDAADFINDWKLRREQRPFLRKAIATLRQEVDASVKQPHDALRRLIATRPMAYDLSGCPCAPGIRVRMKHRRVLELRFNPELPNSQFEHIGDVIGTITEAMDACGELDVKVCQGE